MLNAVLFCFSLLLEHNNIHVKKNKGSVKEKAPTPLAPVFLCQFTVPHPDCEQLMGARGRIKEEAKSFTQTLFELANKIY